MNPIPKRRAIAQKKQVTVKPDKDRNIGMPQPSPGAIWKSLHSDQIAMTAAMNSLSMGGSKRTAPGQKGTARTAKGTGHNSNFKLIVWTIGGVEPGQASVRVRIRSAGPIFMIKPLITKEIAGGFAGLRSGRRARPIVLFALADAGHRFRNTRDCRASVEENHKEVRANERRNQTRYCGSWKNESPRTLLPSENLVVRKIPATVFRPSPEFSEHYFVGCPV
jgi:hypothetical protein